MASLNFYSTTRPKYSNKNNAHLGGAFFCVLLTATVGLATPAFADDGLSEALQAVRNIDVNGKGHESAVEAMKVINAASVEQVPEILRGMDDANRLATNWLRCAIVSIVGRDKDIPKAAIKEYYDETSHSPLGRLLAFDLLTEGNKELGAKMTLDLIDDPSLPLRAKAIAAHIEMAKSSMEPIKKVGTLAFALDKARDVGQVQQIAKMLAANGVDVDLQQQFGFLDTWHLAGSFDNKDEAGFDSVLGPEKDLESIDLAATYDDAIGEPASWTRHTTGHATGVLDLNETVGKVKGATVYAFAVFEAEESRPAEIRIGTPNATKIWLNGELVMENEIYHNSDSIDKFSGQVELKEGKNQILIKVCQNEQTEPWAQDWGFQLRICDESGKAIKPVTSPPSE